MPVCRLCGAQFRNVLFIEGKRRNVSHRKYCVNCSPWGRHNTRRLHISGLNDGGALDLSPTKFCPNCKREKPNAEFYIGANGRRTYSWCRRCNNEHRIARFREDRYAALLHYSGGDIKCACCGERRLEFLSLDHINDDGASHRRTLRMEGGGRFYTWLRRTGYTYPDLAVACCNCNMARAWYGRCPHKPP
jgi:hypothetical protein